MPRSASVRAGGDLQLRLDDVDGGDLFGDRVLDLDTGVHLDEHVAAVGCDEELDGARVQVTDGSGEGHAVGPQPLPHALAEVRRRSDLDHLLVPALDGAVPLVEVDHVAGAVGQHLDLDVARPFHRGLEEDRRVAESRSGLPCGRLDGRPQVLGPSHPAEAPAAAPGRSLYEQREADVLAGGHQVVDVVPRAGAREYRDAGRFCLLFGRYFVAGEGEDIGPGGRRT